MESWVSECYLYGQDGSNEEQVSESAKEAGHEQHAEVGHHGADVFLHVQDASRGVVSNVASLEIIQPSQ